MAADNSLLLNRVFTRNALNDMLNGVCPEAYMAVVRRFNIDATNKSNAEILNSIYTILRVSYRNEYFYKNTILNKLLIGVHKPTTTTALTEVTVGKAKADFVLINGKAVVYEIKTALDNLDRLEAQISNYYKAFTRVSVLTCEEHYDTLQRRLSNTSVGICVLSKGKRSSISVKKAPQEYSENLDLDTIFRMLRKIEYEGIIRKHFGRLPEVSQFSYYKTCKKLFCGMDTMLAYAEFLTVLKRRVSIDTTMYRKVPESLKFLAYFKELNDKDYTHLMEFLDRKEECPCISRI